MSTKADLAKLLARTEHELSAVLDTVNQVSYYRTKTLQKSNGQKRLIHAVREPMRALQQELLATLSTSKIYSPTKFAHGFVAGRSIVTNASVHKRKRLVVKVDIKDFFPSISFNRVVGLFGAWPFEFEQEAAFAAAQICCTQGTSSRLPQGGAMSPYVSNMVCRRMDKRLSALASEHRCAFSRYADDITFSTNDTNRIQVGDLLEQVYAVLESEGFAPNLAKTRVLRRAERQIIAGVVVNEGLNVPRRNVRNLRALLHNCEKNGIASQIERTNGFKDERNSRLMLTRLDSGEFRAGHRVISAKEAEDRFVRHMVGRLMFVRQVVLADGQGEREASNPRVGLFFNLMYRLYALIEPNHKRAAAGLLRQLREHAPSREKLALLEIGEVLKEQAPSETGAVLKKQSPLKQAEKLKRKALRRYRRDPKVVSDLAKLKKAQKNEELMEIVKERRKTDARFFSMSCSGALKKEKQNVEEKLNFPAFNANATFNLLMSLKDSNAGLGALVHEVEGFDGKRAQERLHEFYYPHYYEFPYELRRSFDDFILKLDARIGELGPSQPINPLIDPVLGGPTCKLKRETRFMKNPNQGSLLGEVVHEAFGSAIKRVSEKNVNMVQDLKRTFFFTHVPTIEAALIAIFESMLRNTESANIFVRSRQEGDYAVLSVSDNSNKRVEKFIGREFANGKIREAARLLNGFCSYEIEATDQSGEHFRVNMLSDTPSESLGKSDSVGFHHLMYFRV